MVVCLSGASRCFARLAALYLRGAPLGRRVRRDLGKLAGVVAQPFVEQRVDVPLGFVRFFCKVFVSHLHRYAVTEPLLDEVRIEAIDVIPNAADLLARP